MRRNLVQSRPRRERLLKPEDVADVFDVCKRTVIGWATSGRLPFVLTPGGQYRFRAYDVDALVDIPDDEVA
ncbi:helix-turn-helix domain-containing protein [Nonomuraea sp. CA-143628]|uniref:helix-turn-helix domain-containing protein n=1 Tax=Nonomuraea sp. CA-143628 TaxID=3239997 RepID=UPI003D8D4D06